MTKYISVFAAIFLMPIYTRTLTKVDYGVMDIFNSWNGFIIMILPLGLITTIFRYYHDFNRNEKKKKVYLGTIFISLIILCLLYAAITFLLRERFVLIIEHKQINEILNHSIFIVCGTTILSYYLTIAQSKYDKFKYLLISLIQIILLISLGFVFVYHYKMGVTGFFRASSIGIGSALLISTIFYHNELSLSFSSSILKRLLKYSIHILSVGLLFSATNLLDRYLLLKYGDLEDVGIYSVGMRISSIIGFAVSSFAIAWFPRAMQIKDDENKNETYQRIHNFFMLVAFLSVIAITLMRSEIINIVAPDYDEAYQIIAILSLFSIVNGFIYFYSLGIHIKEKTKFLTIAAIISIGVNIITSIVLLKWIGINGVAWGTLIGGFVWVTIQYYYSHKIMPIKFNLYYPVFGFILFAFTFLFSHYFDLIGLSLVWAFLIKSLLLLLILITIIWKQNKNLKSFFDR